MGWIELHRKPGEDDKAFFAHELGPGFVVEDASRNRGGRLPRHPLCIGRMGRKDRRYGGALQRVSEQVPLHDNRGGPWPLCPLVPSAHPGSAFPR